MKHSIIALLGRTLGGVAVLLIWSVTHTGAAATLDTAAIERLVGAKGEFLEKEEVFKVSLPRQDLDINIAGVTMTPPMGLTSWVAFQRAEHRVMVMGDVVLLEDQVNPVMSVALDHGLEVTALHSRFFWDTPKVMFMHITGMGSETRLAEAVGKVFAKISETSAGKVSRPRVALSPAQTSLEPRIIEEILGTKGQMHNGVYKVIIGRMTTMYGHVLGHAMGINTWAAFVGSNEQAVVNGDIAMIEDELQPVLKALRGAGIHVMAIHNHMTMEMPRIVYLHYWGVGSTRQLAMGLKAAFDTQLK